MIASDAPIFNQYENTLEFVHNNDSFLSQMDDSQYPSEQIGEDFLRQPINNQSSLTPTPEDEQFASVENEPVECSQVQAEGPALVVVRSLDDDDEEVEVDVPESEYLSDPDFHDERPGKKSLEELLEERKSRRLRFKDRGVSLQESSGNLGLNSFVIRSNSCREYSELDDRLTASEITNKVEEEEEEEEESEESSRDTCRYLNLIARVSSATNEIDGLNTDSQAITASEAQAELFVDESTLADDIESLQLHSNQQVEYMRETSELEVSQYPISDGSEGEEDDTTTPIRPEEEREGSLDDIASELLDNQEENSELIGEVVQELAFSLVEMLISSALDHLEQQQVAQINMANLERKKIYTSSLYYDDSEGSYPTLEKQVEQCQAIAKQLKGFRIEQLHRGEPELSKVIVSSSSNVSSSENELNSKASIMFKRRKDRMRRFTLQTSAKSDLKILKSEEKTHKYRYKHRRLSLESGLSMYKSDSLRRSAMEGDYILNKLSDSLKEEGNCILDKSDSSEHQAVQMKQRSLPGKAITIRSKERTFRQEEINNRLGEEEEHINEEQTFKPFLDSSFIKDIERLRNWSPRVEFNEHNSVSPELCHLLVEDLRGEVCKRDHLLSIESANKCSSSNILLKEPTTSKGAKLFERRQLQSSDWIVNGSNKDEQVVESVVISDGTIQQPSNREINPISPILETTTSKPSLIEESVMITADETNNEPIIVEELIPLVMQHAQPKFELATVTKTPSFSASSRLVIECDSPDLLGSHSEEDDEDDKSKESSDSSCDEEINIEFNLDNAEEVPLVSIEQLVVSVDAGDREEDKMISSTTSEQQLPTSTVLMSATKSRQFKDEQEETMKRATLIEWRARVMTPTWLHVEEAEPLDCAGNYSLVRYKMHLPTTMDTYYNRPTARAPSASITSGSSQTIECGSREESGNRVSALCSSYQNALDHLREPASRQYRSYHYPYLRETRCHHQLPSTDRVRDSACQQEESCRYSRCCQCHCHCCCCHWPQLSQFNVDSNNNNNNNNRSCKGHAQRESQKTKVAHEEEQQAARGASGRNLVNGGETMDTFRLKPDGGVTVPTEKEPPSQARKVAYGLAVDSIGGGTAHQRQQVAGPSYLSDFSDLSDSSDAAIERHMSIQCRPPRKLMMMEGNETTCNQFIRSAEVGQVCDETQVQICIKLPCELHQVVIYRVPKVEFASEVGKI